MPKRILIYCPFGQWDRYIVFEAVMALALKARGAEIRLVTCDGVFAQCHVHTNPALAKMSPEGICALCKSTGAQALDVFQLPRETVGEIIGREEMIQAREWADALPVGGLDRAEFKGYPLFEWIRSNVNTKLRNKDIDFDDPEVQAIIRENLRSARMTVAMAEKVLDGFDAVWMFGGRYASHRPLFEIARLKGIDVYTYDMGPLKGQMISFRNRLLYDDYKDCREIYRLWRDVPVTRHEAEMASAAIDDRVNGHKKHAWMNFTTGFRVKEYPEILSKLNYRGQGRLITYFSSSEDEMYHLLGDKFLTMESIITELARFVESREGWRLAIRMHPNLMSRQGGTSFEPLSNVYRTFTELAGPKVALLLPTDPISSYALMDLSDVVVTTVSTMTMEAAIKGKAVIACSKAGVYGIEEADHGIRCVSTKEGLIQALEEFPDSRNVPEQIRHMHRYVYVKYYRSKRNFPLFRDGRPPLDMDPETLKGMLPGGTGVLADLCGCVLDGSPMHTGPSADEKSRSRGEEDAMLPAKVEDYRMLERETRKAAEEAVYRASRPVHVFVWGSGDAEDLRFTFASLDRCRHKPEAITLVTDRLDPEVIAPYCGRHRTLSLAEAVAAARTAPEPYRHLLKTGDEANEYLYYEADAFLKANAGDNAVLFREIGVDGYRTFIGENVLEEEAAPEALSRKHLSCLVFRAGAESAVMPFLFSRPEGELFLEACRVSRLGRMATVGILAKQQGKPAAMRPSGYPDVRAKVAAVCGAVGDEACRRLFESVRSLPDGASIVQLGARNAKATLAMAYACVGTSKRLHVWDPLSCPPEGTGYGVQARRWIKNVRRHGLLPFIGILRGTVSEALASIRPSSLILLAEGLGDSASIQASANAAFEALAEGGTAAMVLDGTGQDDKADWGTLAARLSSIEVSGGLALGVKGARSDAPFSRSRAFIAELLRLPEAGIYAAALESFLSGSGGSLGREQALIVSESRVRNMPAECRDALRAWISAHGGDGYLHFWNALALESEDRLPEALAALEAAGREPEPVPEERLLRHLERVRTLALALSVAQPVDHPAHGGRPDAARHARMDDRDGAASGSSGSHGRGSGDAPQPPAGPGWSPVPRAEPGRPRHPGYRTYEEARPLVESVEGWLLEGQEKFLFDKVKALPDGATVLEMGANFGRSTVALGLACVGTDKRVYSIDTFCGNEGVMGKIKDLWEGWQENVRRCGVESYVTPLRGYTFDVLKDRSRFPAPSFVFIDASHEFNDVLLDFKDIYDYVPIGGWIAFHDVEVNWPGCWRVWLDYGRHLLTDHQQVATLACGRKSAALPFGRAPRKEPGFSYAQALIEEFHNRYGAGHPLCRALGTSFEGKCSSQAEREALNAAEIRIAEAPESDFRSGLDNMMVVKDGGMDGHIRLWYGLTLIAEGKVERAFEHLRAAAQVSYPVPRSRVEPYLDLIRRSGKGGFPAGFPEPGPRAAAFRAHTKASDIVIAYGSGEGDLLFALDGARKIGIEPDCEARKKAIGKHGIDSVADVMELPDGCADAIFCLDRLHLEPAPLEVARKLASKLRRGGRAVFTIPPVSRPDPATLYGWVADSLANLLAAAGFVAKPIDIRETGDGITLVVEKG